MIDKVARRKASAAAVAAAHCQMDIGTLRNRIRALEALLDAK